MKDVLELTREIRQTIKELEDAASKTEVLIEAQKTNSDQINISPNQISEEEERGLLEKLNELYEERARMGE